MRSEAGTIFKDISFRNKKLLCDNDLVHIALGVLYLLGMRRSWLQRKHSIPVAIVLFEFSSRTTTNLCKNISPPMQTPVPDFVLQMIIPDFSFSPFLILELLR